MRLRETANDYNVIETNNIINCYIIDQIKTLSLFDDKTIYQNMSRQAIKRIAANLNNILKDIEEMGNINQ